MDTSKACQILRSQGCPASIACTPPVRDAYFDARRQAGGGYPSPRGRTLKRRAFSPIRSSCPPGVVVTLPSWHTIPGVESKMRGRSHGRQTVVIFVLITDNARQGRRLSWPVTHRECPK